MILKIRNSVFGKATSLLMVVVFLLTTFNPNQAYGLTGGPAQPEFNSFTPIGTSDMVDLASGDFTYNIPLMDVGGFPINLAYNSGVTMDDEASWVGLGWNLSIGQINRDMRGLPDDFEGEQMQYENNVKDNYTIGTSFNGNAAFLGVDDFLPAGADMNFGLGVEYNSYTGMSMSLSAGMSYDAATLGSVALNIKSTPEGLVVSPNASLHAKYKTAHSRNNSVSASVGVSFNSRQGLSSINMSASRRSVVNTAKKNKISSYATAGGISSSVVSYVDNHYTPSVTDGMNTVNFTFNAAIGMELLGGEGQGQIAAYGSNQFLSESEKNKQENSYGYEYTHLGDAQSVLDFNREKDGNFSINSTNLPITNYTYDIYAVQGQGVSGMFRPYRSQVGYVHDNETKNVGGGLSGGLELGPGQTFHIGGDIEITYTQSQAGSWIDGNLAEPSFSSEPNTNPNYEEVYFKNVGDLSVDEDRIIYGGSGTKFGGYFPARLAITGGAFDRKLANAYEIKDPISPVIYNNAPLVENDLKRTSRVRRNQAILKVTLEDAAEAQAEGFPLTGFVLNPPSGVGASQTAGFIVTRNDGARYIYGQALYNTKKREVTFAVGEELGASEPTPGLVGDCSSGLVAYTAGTENSLNNFRGDHYFNRVSTPAYAHTFLLKTLLSSDYSDVDLTPGPSSGDFGSYTNFEYKDRGTYKWRIPYEQNKANYNEGLKTDPTDDKASYVYGEKETRYIQKIETKTHVALFYTSPRHDAYGVDGENGSPVNSVTNSKMYQLDKIALYSRGEFYNLTGGIVGAGTDVNGNLTTTATPIKETYFEYDYSMCKNVPNNDHAAYDGNYDGILDDNQGGKLTLKKVYFTYRNSKMGKYSSYDFRYGDTNHDGLYSVGEIANRNPNYNLKGYDIWGNYKPNDKAAQGCDLFDQLSAPEFNYVDQEDPNADNYTAAWTITDIELPSGGEIQVDYESDDYAYVQDKKPMRMFKIAGAGVSVDPTTGANGDVLGTFNEDLSLPISQLDNEALLYNIGNSNNQEAKYLYIKLAQADQTLTSSDVNLFVEKYLKEIANDQGSLIQFRMLMNVNHQGGKNNSSWTEGNFDYVTGYFKLDPTAGYAIFNHNGAMHASIPVTLVDMENISGTNVNPMAKASWHFARKYLPQYINTYPFINEGDEPGVIVNTLLQAADNLKETFVGANGLLRGKEIGRRFIPEKSWIRLMDPTDHKKGGGCRIKQLAMTDEWANMTSNETGGLDPLRDQKYGQQYTYTTTDLSGNTYSSGVATYEPMGAKDNPFCQPVFVNETRMLAPDEENYMEKPFGESFFPSPSITYSRVEVKNLDRKVMAGTSEIVVQKHATGSVVTEFFTSRDYPTIVDQTKLDAREDDPGILANLLNLSVKKHITLTQGYVVHVNDMNGKMKSQRVYGEDQTKEISGVDYIYDGITTQDPLYPDDPFKVVSNPFGHLNNDVRALYPNGEVHNKTLGVEFDIINDFREMSSTTEIIGVNGNVATFFVGLVPAIVPVPLPDYAHHEDKLNMSVTTKVINSFGIMREVIAHDAGASVYTRNLLWDAYTGEVLLTETVNEYGDKYYSLNYPAHWYYSGMGMASLNLGMKLKFTSGTSGNQLAGAYNEDDYLHNGDEVIYRNIDNGDVDRAWVDAVSTTEFKLIDENGIEITGLSTVENIMQIYRSGRRNIQSTSMASVVFMNNPLEFLVGGANPLITDDFLESTSTPLVDDRIINAGAVEFSDDWALQCECGIDNVNGVYNKYRYNTKGVWRALRSHLFLTGRQNTTDPDPRNEGFYTSFSPFYQIDNGEWTIHNAGWTFTSLVTKFSPYGFELENKDALNRYSAAQYGYNFTFPLAVGANTPYSQIGFDGFEDYFFDGCTQNVHFGFRDVVNPLVSITDQESHTGKYSIVVTAGSSIQKLYQFNCQ